MRGKLSCDIVGLAVVGMFMSIIIITGMVDAVVIMVAGVVAGFG